MDNKQHIRKELLKRRNTLPEEQRQKYSKIITAQVFSLNQYIHADILLIYASYRSEVSTYKIIEHALNTNKKVFCPKVLSSGIMEFYEITSLEDIVLGYKDIPEPKTTEFPFPNAVTLNTLMIMPLVGFDDKKNRLGYGGGFYDRYLQRFPDMKPIALAYECQKYESEITVEATDIKPALILTEQRVF